MASETLKSGIRTGIQSAVRVLLIVVLALAIQIAESVSFKPLSAQGVTISEIVVEGTARVDPATVQAYLQVDVGDPFDPDLLNRSIKALFATDLFADVRYRREGSRLIVTITENPMINRIAFEGNLRIPDEDLAREIESQTRQVYTRTKVQRDVQRLLKIYQRTGRFATRIDPKVIKQEQNRVDLVFEVSEGPLNRIRRIVFVGNRRFSDSDLRDEIRSREYAFWRFLATSDSYDPDRLGLDRELLRRVYLRHGYVDFKVVSAVAELTPDRADFVLNFTLEEGRPYRYGAVDIRLNLPRVDKSELVSGILTAEGDWYNVEDVEESIEQLTDKLGTLGYAFVDVRPELRTDPENGTVDIDYVVREGPKVFVERIDIEGNVRTLDSIIRREFELVEGDAFNVAKLRRTRRQLINLGFFRSVDLNSEEGTASDQTVLTAVVEEQSTGQISFGAGFSSIDGVIGDIGISERNLLGRGQYIKFQIQTSENSRQFDISFSEPYFLDRDILAGIDLFRTDRSREADIVYDSLETGGGVRLGYDLAQDLRQVVGYEYKEVKIENVSDGASKYIKEQEGVRSLSQVRQTLTYDKRDNRIDPRTGYLVSMTNDFVGLGGSTRFIRTRLRTGYYVPVFDESVVKLALEGGYVTGINQDLNISDRFFIGGRTLRGFSGAGIGPRDASTEDALGGNAYYVGTTEFMFPLGLPEDLGMRGSLFADFGSLWELDSTGPDILDENSVRASVGFGIGWQTALGLLRIDFANAVLKEDFDETESIRFSFGTRF